MSERNDHRQQGQSIVIVAMAMIVLVIFAAIALDVADAYVHRRTAQNAADGAALAGARDLARQLNECSLNPNCSIDDNFWMYSSEIPIMTEMNDFAERNGILDTDEIPANHVNLNVVGYYLGADGLRISDGEDEIIIGATDIVHPDARGVEAIANSLAPSFFSGIIGLDGIPVSAEASVVFEPVCADNCVMPIATLTETFQYDECYNIYDGWETGSFGWLNWQFQWEGDTCHCSAVCTVENLGLDCASGPINVGDWVASDSGLSNTRDVRNRLLCYAGLPLQPGGSVECPDEGTPTPFTVIIYDVAECMNNKCDECAKWAPNYPRGLAYHVVGFAKFQLLGFSLATGGGGGQSFGHDGTDCLGPEPTGGNRLTGVFLQWVEGSGGDCNSFGTIVAPRMIK
jgi:hypothetical protein